jgi:hypothetical protein
VRRIKTVRGGDELNRSPAERTVILRRLYNNSETRPTAQSLFVGAKMAICFMKKYAEAEHEYWTVNELLLNKVLQFRYPYLSQYGWDFPVSKY